MSLCSVDTDTEALWHGVRAHCPAAEQERLAHVFELAARLHGGQYRMPMPDGTAAPYIVHPLRVARIAVEEFGRADYAMLATCLLHDVLEDCPIGGEAAIQETAGKKVFDAVWKLTKPQLPFVPDAESRARRAVRYFTVLRSAPKWVRLVKCADRLDNLREACAVGNIEFWERYSSETIGWHLILAHETSPVAETAIFEALVVGERALRGRVPVWADGRIVDPVAAALVPEHVARLYGAVGLALRGETLVLGVRRPDDPRAIDSVRMLTGKRIEPVPISAEALDDVLAAGLFGAIGDAAEPAASGHRSGTEIQTEEHATYDDADRSLAPRN